MAPKMETNSKSTPAIDRVQPILEFLGITPRQFWALSRAYVAMDLRSQYYGRATATKPEDLIPPLFWVIGQCLLVSMVSVVMFARVDAFFFAFICLAASMCVIASAIIVEFNEVVLDPKDIEIIGHLPIPARTYSAVRLLNLFFYVLLMTVALNLFPSVLGLGLRDTGWAFLPAYLTAALLGNFFVVGIIILFYLSILKGHPGEAAKEVLAWTQIVLIMVFFYFGQLLLRDPKHSLEMTAYHPPDWINYLPPAWMAYFVEGCSPDRPATVWWIPLLALFLVCSIWCVVHQGLAQTYGHIQPVRARFHPAEISSVPRRTRLGGFMVRYLTRSPTEACSFWFCSTMLSRDHELKMRSWPVMSIVIAPLFLGVFSDQLKDPIISPGTSCVLSLASLYLLAFPWPNIINNLNFSRDYEASWVLWTAPITEGSSFAEGIRKAVTYHLFVPVYLIVMITFAAVWRDPVHVVGHALIGWLVILGAGYGAQLLVMHRLPFSAPLTRGETMGSISVISAIYSGLLTLFAIFHYYFVTTEASLFSYVAVLAVMVLLIRRVSLRTFSSSFAFGRYYE